MDFRGYLQSLSQNQNDPNAFQYHHMLDYTGNDGRIDPTKDLYETSIGSLFNTDENRAKTQGQVDTAYNQYMSQQGGSFGGAASGGGSRPDYSNDIKYLDDQNSELDRLLNSSGNTLKDGILQLDDDTNKLINRNNEAKGQAIAGYDTQRQDTTRGKQGAINQVNTGARTLADSVRRILGLAGGSNSSAYREVAPNAIARDASTKRTGVNETYGKNFRDIDTAEQGSMAKFSQYLEDLNNERRQKESSLRGGVLEQEQGIYADKADIARKRALLNGGDYASAREASGPAQGAIASRQTALDQLFSQFRNPYQVKDVTANTPQLSNYTVDKSTIGNNQQNNGYSPYGSFLKKKFATA